MRNKPRKSTWLCVAILVYATIMAVCFLPTSTATTTEKWLSGVGSYVLVGLLWIVMRKKEKMAEKRNNSFKESNTKEHMESNGSITEIP